MKRTTEEKTGVPMQLEDIGRRIGEFKDVVVKELKNMEVEVKSWKVDVAKSEEEYTLEVDVKLAVRPKKEK